MKRAPIHLNFTRADLLARYKTRPLIRISLRHLRGTSLEQARADTLIVREGGKALILKDRQGDFLDLTRDVNGLVDETLLKKAPF